MEIDKTFIYALVCPETGCPRYIGKSNEPLKRLYSHLTDGRLNHRHMWLFSLKEKGKMPIVEILDTVSVLEWPFWERYYISLYKSWGFPLLNKTDGGEGSTFHSLKTRKSFSGENNPMFGKKRPEVGEMSKRLRKGKNYNEIYGNKEKSDKIKKKQSEWSKTRILSDESRIKLSNSLKGRKFSDSHIESMKISSFFKGKKGAMSPYAIKIIQFDLDGNFIREWSSLTEAAQSFNKSHSNISNCLTGKIKSAFGFIWKYK